MSLYKAREAAILCHSQPDLSSPAHSLPWFAHIFVGKEGAEMSAWSQGVCLESGYLPGVWVSAWSQGVCLESGYLPGVGVSAWSRGVYLESGYLTVWSWGLCLELGCLFGVGVSSWSRGGETLICFISGFYVTNTPTRVSTKLPGVARIILRATCHQT